VKYDDTCPEGQKCYSECGCVPYFFYLASLTPPYDPESVRSSYGSSKPDQCCYYSAGETDWQDIEVVKAEQEQSQGVTKCNTGYLCVDDSTSCRSVGTLKCIGYEEDCDPDLPGEDYCCRCIDIGPGPTI